jgi:hypothetical protein
VRIKGCEDTFGALPSKNEGLGKKLDETFEEMVSMVWCHSSARFFA